MKIYITYFYNIRFLKENQLPFSTAVWDPKWFHKGKGPNFTYEDKRGVINGLRVEVLNPSRIENDKECIGCIESNGADRHPESCGFIKHYKSYLDSLDFNQVIEDLERRAKDLMVEHQKDGEPEIVLIVHEATNNPCSERGPLKKWFSEHGVDLVEWTKDLSM
jgi:hypothetical protein